MAYQTRQTRPQEPQYQYRSNNYARQHDGYGQSQQDERMYSQNPREQQWQQQQYNHHQEAYSNNQQYSNAYDHDYHRDDQYGQDVNRYNDQQYSQHQYQEQGYAPEPQQQRQYQYDDRYRDDSRAAQAQAQAPHGGQPPSGRRSPRSQSRPGTSASNRRLKQERILNKAESPKASAWDNPFGVFPGTKKDIEKKKKQAGDSRSQSRTETPPGRPSTSSSNRAPVPVSSKKQSIDESRPRTAHGGHQHPPNTSYYSSDQPLSPSEDMPLRKNPPAEYHEDYNSYAGPTAQSSRSHTQALPMRPAMKRSATGPLPQSEPMLPDARTMPQDMGRYSVENGRARNPRSLELPAQHYSNPEERFETSQQPDQRYQQAGQAVYAELPASNGRMSQDQPSRNARNLQDSLPNPYRTPHDNLGNPSMSNNRLSDRVPDFSPNNSSVGNLLDRELALHSEPPAQEPKPQIYRKPTFGDMSSKPPPIRPGLASPPLVPTTSSSNTVSTPTGGFDFGLPSGASSHHRSPQNQRSPQHDVEGVYTNTQQQFPPRNGSRAPPQGQRPTNGFTHPYNQPPVRPQPATNHSQRPPPSRQEYGFDDQVYPQQPQQPQPRGNGFPRNDQYISDQDHRAEPQGHMPLARTYTEPVNQPGGGHYNHGYEQRRAFESEHNYANDGRNIQNPRADSFRPAQEPIYDRLQDAPPPRPRTANSTRGPPQQFSSQPMPAFRPPSSDYAIADRNHPVPVRPGLMEQVPVPSPSPAPAPPAQQISPPRNIPQSSQHTRQASDPTTKKPVTTQELNELRNALKERPNDDKLGLEFAKRLVEAGSVLASEGGRADPKTAAKNRERYINDAYRTVKKLVSNGSVEAMFYLADCYGSGQLGLEVNPKEAFQLYTSAAKLGHAQSTYRVAVCCELGPDGGGGTRRDHFKAVQFYKKAATLGDGPAMFKMGMVLLKGLLGAQPNRREGISWLKRAAERADEENPHALHELASLYENAQSTDVIIRDDHYALQLYTQAANLGYRYSQWRLGSAFEYGTLGVQIDPRQSIGWYTRAAAQGEHQSEFALSGWYLTGSEPLLAQSDQEAYLWARKAASSGLSKAEYAMGYYTEVGIGCRSDIEEAKKWYFRAAAQSDNRAKERLEEIKRGGARKEKTRISRTNVGRQNEGECSVM